MYHKVRLCTIPIILLCSVLAIIVSGACLSGCKNSQANDAKFASSTPDTITPVTPTPDTTTSETSTTGTTPVSTLATTDPTLVWDAPKTYTDGSALLDLKEYRVYFSTSPSPYSTGSYYQVPAPTSSVKVKDVISLGTGTYYFVVTALDSINRESDPSNVVSKHLN